MKQDERLIIVGGWFGDRFADNSRYFYLQSKLQDKYDVYFITKDKNILNELKYDKKVIKKWSLKSIYLHLKTKYHVIDQSRESLIGFLSINAIHINLWHAIPLKKIWKVQSYKRKNKFAQIIFDYTNQFKKIMNGYCSVGKWDVFYLVCPSNYVWDNIFLKCIFVDFVKPIFCKYSRTDYLMNHSKFDYKLLKEEEIYLNQLDFYKKQGKKLFFMFQLLEIK